MIFHETSMSSITKNINTYSLKSLNDISQGQRLTTIATFSNFPENAIEIVNLNKFGRHGRAVLSIFTNFW